MGWLEYNKKSTKPRRGLNLSPEEPQTLAVVPPQQDEGRETRLYEVKKRVHHCLLERLDLQSVGGTG